MGVAGAAKFAAAANGGRFVPFHQRVQEFYKKRRNRQLPFLSVSKEPSLPRPPVDPRERRLIKVDLAREMNIVAGDRVQVLYGSEQGRQGVISKIDQQTNQVYVSGINMKRSFWHPQPGPGKPSIVSIETPIHITNVTLLDPVLKKPTRVKRRVMMNGEVVRVSKLSGSAMPEPVPVKENVRDVLWRQHEQVLADDKGRRGPPKENIMDSKKHFQMLVRIMRERRGATFVE